MFLEFYGYRQLEKKWHDLFMCVKSDDDETSMFLVNVTKKFIEVVDGQQSIRMNREVEHEIDPGYYLLTKDRLMVPVDEKDCDPPIKFPKLDVVFSKKGYTKTADFKIGTKPLVAMAHAMNEFGCTIELDAHRKTFESIAKLMPGGGCIFGYKKAAEAQKHGLHIQFTVETITFEYIVMQKDLDKSQYLTVHPEPCLFDNQESGEAA